MAAIPRFCLLIGTMKGGTTTLFQHLAQHPEIAAARVKEPNFFSRAELRDRGPLGYEALWDFDAERHAWALEASTEYSKLPSFPSAAFFLDRVPADYRILYVVRDPLERLRSEYRHGLAQGFLTQPIHERLAPHTVATGNYHLQLWPYVVALGRERILVLDHRELLHDLPAVLARVAGFLGLEPRFPAPDLTHHNTSGQWDQRNLARMLHARGLLPKLISHEALAALSPLEFNLLCRDWAREAGHPSGYAETASAYQRAITPTREQATFVRAVLRDDLLRFRDDWGIDPWSAAQAATAAAAA